MRVEQLGESRNDVLEHAGVVRRRKDDEQVGSGVVEPLQQFACDLTHRLDRRRVQRQCSRVPVHEIHCPRASALCGHRLSDLDSTVVGLVRKSVLRGRKRRERHRHRGTALDDRAPRLDCSRLGVFQLAAHQAIPELARLDEERLLVAAHLFAVRLPYEDGLQRAVALTLVRCADEDDEVNDDDEPIH